jgi:2-polyprenyl-3-methyl-5-hydroxy-6-metoxy-1,4-benzoquinol methylase
MAKQNIYDDEKFFDGYRKLRERDVNANVLFEIPTLLSLLPDLKGKRVLDLGCGFGEHCKDYIRQGAVRVVGVDISEKMLRVANEENSDPNIEYMNIPMEDIGSINETFDVVISSLHYIDDFPGVVRNVYSLLSDGGIFLFSQEHPVNTCYNGRYERWTFDENGKKIYANLANYCVEKQFESTWFVDGVQKYHRMLSTVVNTLADAGFTIQKMAEPYPTQDILDKYPQYYDNLHKPDFLFVKSAKL